MEVDAPTCQACLGLNYELFQELDEPRRDGRTHVRYRALPLRVLESSGAKGCPYCVLLCQGMTLLWQSKLCPDEIIEGSEIGICIQRRLEECLSLSRYTIGTDKEPWQSRVNSPAAELEFFTKKGLNTFHPAFAHVKDVPTNLDVARCIKLIRGWLRNCNINHPNCSAIMSKAPKRLIDVSREIPSLVETKGLTFAKYVTLSHCWGKGQHPMKTTKGTTQQRKAGLRWSRLPRVFQDAIKITRLIGCDWLWIDSLCIIQDDISDWNEEALRMSDYYSGSFLNIAATRSSGSSGSLFSERESWSDYYDRWQRLRHNSIELTKSVNGDTTGVFVRSSLSAAHEHITDGNRRGAKSVLIEKSPLLNRAWAFQERLLSPRTVHFCTTEMVWECASSITCECTGSNAVLSSDSFQNAESLIRQSTKSMKAQFSTVIRDRIPKQLVLDFWLRAVEQYSSLALTNTSDRPFALAGIAQVISPYIRSQYLAGIWAADLPRALLWRSCGMEKRIVLPTVPTWSWMCRYEQDNCCDIGYDLIHGKDFKKDHRLKVHSSKTFCSTVNGEQFGTIISGQIVLTGALITGRVSIRDGFYYLTSKSFQFGATRIDHIDSVYDSNKVQDGEVLLCLMVGSAEVKVRLNDSRELLHYNAEFALILRHKENQVGAYERIGIIEFRLPLGIYLKGAKTRLIKLV